VRAGRGCRPLPGDDGRVPTAWSILRGRYADVYDRGNNQAMDLQSAPGWLAIPVAIYGVYLQRRQIQIMATEEMPRAARRRGDVPQTSWLKSPAVAVLATLVLLAWLPWVISQFEEKPLLNKGMACIAMS
jgi:hypothetical protein